MGCLSDTTLWLSFPIVRLVFIVLSSGFCYVWYTCYDLEGWLRLGGSKLEYELCRKLVWQRKSLQPPVPPYSCCISGLRVLSSLPPSPFNWKLWEGCPSYWIGGVACLFGWVFLTDSSSFCYNADTKQWEMSETTLLPTLYRVHHITVPSIFGEKK